jgi:aromatic-L-amino-acid/L-tryptophan decarboxylase
MIQLKEFRARSQAISAWIERYFESLEAFPVKSQVKPGEIYNRIPPSLPGEPEEFGEIMSDLDRIILPGITHWQHPNFHAYFTANNSVESVLAETITAAIGAQCMIWETSPAAAELEQRMLEWLRDAMALPAAFEGVIQDSASSATLAAILTAREVKTGFTSNEEGVPSNLRIYGSSQTHSSVDKSVAISGIGRKNYIRIPVDERMRMIPPALESQIRGDLAAGLVPCCVVATIGTTGTLAVDPVRQIGEICARYGVWLHIDAAYAGSALLLPEYRWMAEGAEYADSFVFNPHKWLFTNFDCSAYFVRDAAALIRTFEVLPEYLKTRTRGTVNDYRDWGIPLGRRFRALKLWFVLRSYGLSGLREKLREHIRLNELFARELTSAGDFQWVTAPFLNFTCFRFSPPAVTREEDLNSLNEHLLEELNRSGRIYLSHTKVGGTYALRFVAGQTYLEERHIYKALEALREISSGIPDHRQKSRKLR